MTGQFIPPLNDVDKQQRLQQRIVRERRCRTIQLPDLSKEFFNDHRLEIVKTTWDIVSQGLAENFGIAPKAFEEQAIIATIGLGWAGACLMDTGQILIDVNSNKHPFDLRKSLAHEMGHFYSFRFTSSQHEKDQPKLRFHGPYFYHKNRVSLRIFEEAIVEVGIQKIFREGFQTFNSAVQYDMSPQAYPVERALLSRLINNLQTKYNATGWTSARQQVSEVLESTVWGPSRTGPNFKPLASLINGVYGPKGFKELAHLTTNIVPGNYHIISDSQIDLPYDFQNVLVLCDWIDQDEDPSPKKIYDFDLFTLEGHMPPPPRYKKRPPRL